MRPIKVYYCKERHRPCVFKHRDNGICSSCIQNFLNENTVWCFSCNNLLHCDRTSKLYTSDSKCEGYIKSPYYCNRTASMCDAMYSSKSEKCQTCALREND